MAVIYKGTLANLVGGYKGMSILSGKGATIGGAVTFARPFLNTPAIFLTPTSDECISVASAATTGFTPTERTCTGDGSGTTCDWVAIGRGDGYPATRLNCSENGIDIGDATKDAALTYAGGGFLDIPVVICAAVSDLAFYVASTAKTGFTPTEISGSNGAGTTGKYVSVGPSVRNPIGKYTSTGGSNKDAMWVEIGTYTTLGAKTFAYPFLEAPTVIVSSTTDAVHNAESIATTGFTVDNVTLNTGGTGEGGVYMAIGAKRL